MKLIGAALAVALPFANSVLAEGFSVSSPIDCDLVSDCYIQQYVDSDPSPQASDFACSSLSYDGHKGTDFALPNRARINDNVRVLASAAGKVKSLRDGMVDSPYSDTTATCGGGKSLALWDNPVKLRFRMCIFRCVRRAKSSTPLILTGVPVVIIRVTAICGRNGQPISPEG